jgi:hypothetical protein
MKLYLILKMYQGNRNNDEVFLYVLEIVVERKLSLLR